MQNLLFEIPENSLTTEEGESLAKQEAIIERGLNTFVEVGTALLAIRDGRLYRKDYATFEDYCRERWGMTRRHTNRMIAAASVVENLGPMGPILPATERQARPLASLDTEAQAEVWQRVVESTPPEKITAKVVQDAVDEYEADEYEYNRQQIIEANRQGACIDVPPVKPHVSHNSGENEWYTPPEFIAAARGVMGEIDLDPASSEVANRTVGACVYYTKEDDGLARPWAGRVWMNPPYASDLIGQFTSKLVEHYAAGEITEAIVLVNNATETGWFQGMLEVAAAVCFIRRRVKFIDMAGNPSGAPLQGQAVLYFGDNTDLFGSVFSAFGKVLYDYESARRNL